MLALRRPAARALALARPQPAVRPARKMGHQTGPGQTVGHFDVKKNYFVEEWNGKREITEKIFDYRGAVEVPALIGTMFLFPLVLYAVTKGEMQNSNNTCVNGDRDSKWDVKGNKTAKYM
mmetsp:Transcript_15120/g.39797  ORF Transcript_15120/g.39797 Transcript_15120/m.39797 type:complete len:120 (-) Transcript_15120:92-451(-)